MASRTPATPFPTENDALQADIERMWRERDRLEAEHGDLEAYVDRWAEEMFGTPEATQALVEYVLRSTGELDPEEEEDLTDDAW